MHKIKAKDDITYLEIELQELQEEHEKILIEWADKAMCYSWLHSKSYNLYKILDS